MVVVEITPINGLFWEVLNFLLSPSYIVTARIWILFTVNVFIYKSWQEFFDIDVIIISSVNISLNV